MDKIKQSGIIELAINEVSEIAQVKRQKADEECHWMRELRIEENKSHESVKHILSEAYRLFLQLHSYQIEVCVEPH